MSTSRWTSPESDVNVDRSKAGQAGLTQRDVANSMLISLSSAADRWRPTSGSDWQRRQLSVRVQTPQFRVEFARRPAADADRPPLAP